MIGLTKRSVTVDGSILEGGGQILRVSIALSSLLSLPLEIVNIRGNRPKPGLAAQHLTSVRAASAMVHGELQGCEFRSSTLSFIPQNASKHVADIAKDSFLFQIDTAGAVSLVIQAMLPGFLFGGRNNILPVVPSSSSSTTTSVSPSSAVSVDVIGGTNVAFSPPIDHTIHVLLPLLRHMGVAAATECRIIKRGWNPRGGGRVTLFSPAQTTMGVIGDTTQSGSLPEQASSLAVPIPPDNSACIPGLIRPGTAAGRSVLRGIHLSDQGIPVAIRGVICSNTSNLPVMEAGKRGLLALFRSSKNTTVFPADVPIQIDIDTDNDSADISVETVGTTTVLNTHTNKHNKFSGGGGGGGGKHIPRGCEVCVQLWVETSTGCRISRNLLQNLKKPTPEAMETVCCTLFESLKHLVSSGACVDEHTADQLLVYMALANEPSEILVEPFHRTESSLHMETTIFIVEKFFRRKLFDVRSVGPDNTSCRLITCTPSVLA